MSKRIPRALPGSAFVREVRGRREAVQAQIRARHVPPRNRGWAYEVGRRSRCPRGRMLLPITLTSRPRGQRDAGAPALGCARRPPPRLRATKRVAYPSAEVTLGGETASKPQSAVADIAFPGVTRPGKQSASRALPGTFSQPATRNRAEVRGEKGARHAPTNALFLRWAVDSEPPGRIYHLLL